MVKSARAPAPFSSFGESSARLLNSEYLARFEITIEEQKRREKKINKKKIFFLYSFIMELNRLYSRKRTTLCLYGPAKRLQICSHVKRTLTSEDVQRNQLSYHMECHFSLYGRQIASTQLNKSG